MATNADVVDTFNALLDSIEARTTTWVHEKRIDKAKQAQIIAAAFEPLANDAFQWQKDKELIDAQIAKLNCETDVCRYQLSDILPTQKDEMLANIALLGSKKDNIDYDTNNILPSNKALIEAKKDNVVCDTSKCSYEVSDILPSEKAQIIAKTANIEYDTNTASPAKVALVNAQKDQVVCQTSKCSYEVSDILPAEKANIEAKTANIEYDTAHILPAKVSLTTAQINKITCEISKCQYEVTNILPAEKAKIECEVSKCEYEVAHLLPSQVDLTIAQKNKIECETVGCQYKNTTILPLEATKLQYEIKLIKCQGDKCCYEVDNILPAEKARIEAQTGEINYRTNQLLPAQKDEIVCKTGYCEIQKSELQLNGVSQRDLNTIKGELYTRQKQGFTDKQQQDMLSKLIDIWTVTVAQEIDDENLAMNMTKRDVATNETSGVEATINQIASSIPKMGTLHETSMKNLQLKSEPFSVFKVGTLEYTYYKYEANTILTFKGKCSPIGSILFERTSNGVLTSTVLNPVDGEWWYSVDDPAELVDIAVGDLIRITEYAQANGAGGQTGNSFTGYIV